MHYGLEVKICNKTTFDRDAPLLHVQGMDDRMLPHPHLLLLQPALSVTYHMPSLVDAWTTIEERSDWTADTASTNSWLNAPLPRRASVWTLGIPTVAELCVGLQNALHKGGEENQHLTFYWTAAKATWQADNKYCIIKKIAVNTTVGS